MNPSSTIVLAAGLRLPQARAGGAYSSEDAGHLGARVARELFSRTGLDPAELDEVITGCVGQPHDQANISRVIALRAGVPESVPAQTVARNCASGMQAVTTAVNKIRGGDGSLFLCLGVEVMSAYPLIFNKRAVGFFSGMMRARSTMAKLSAMAKFRPGMLTPRVALTEGLTDPTCGLIMGKTAENLGRDFGIDRETTDTYALESHQRAVVARDSGRLAREILPHLARNARSNDNALEHDDGIRDTQTMEALGKLKPYFERPDGIVTVGNSCGITDGATALIVTTEERALALGMTPLATIRSHAWAGCDPTRMGLGPVFATSIALDRAGVSLSDMGAVELNEAFSTQVLACQRAFASEEFSKEHLGKSKALGEIDDARLNPNGGAIAIGHPVGATGARLLLTMSHEMQINDYELGLATLCIGGGQGGAVILERRNG